MQAGALRRLLIISNNPSLCLLSPEINRYKSVKFSYSSLVLKCHKCAQVCEMFVDAFVKAVIYV